jgi:NADPH:quinone reductase-like Zn-dependent oxidoreductase
MRAYEIQDDFGFDHLVLTDAPRPEPGPGEVLVEMRAVSPNYRDVLMIQGAYNPNQSLPLVPFSDGVGEVVEVGDDVSRWEGGERVCPIFARDWIAGRPTKERFKSALGGPLDGTLREYMALPAESIVAPPEHLSDAEAATLPCAGVTAWNALTEHGDVEAGDTVVCLGTGGVSSFAMTIADMMGAEVIVTSSSDDKLERALELGADHGINYEDDPEWGETVEEMTDGVGADHVVEVGGANTLPQSLKGVRIGGHISLIGVLSGTIDDLNVIPVLMQNVCIQGILVGNREMFERFNRALEVNEASPVVDRVFDFEDVREALQFMASGQHFGKIAIEVGD